MLDNIQASTEKRVAPGLYDPGALYVDDLVRYVTSEDDAIDSLKFGQPITPVAPRRRGGSSKKKKKGASGVVKIRIPKVFQALPDREGGAPSK